MKNSVKCSESAMKKAVMAQIDDFFKTCLVYHPATKGF